jgi:hypothetical protein
VLNILVVLLCLGGAGFGIYMFRQDLNKTLIKLSETPVGIISYKNNGAQRRFSDRFIWSQLQTASPVYNGDIIRTADLSDATIRFPNENSIDLAENCLIQIFYSAEGARIELSGGTLTATAKSGGLVIASGDKELILNAGSAVTTNSTGTDLDIQVTSGTVTLNSGGLVETIEAGSAVTVTEDGRVETPPRVVVLSPLPDTQILSAENAGQQIQFSWRKNNFSSNEGVRLEIAADRHFTRLTESLDAAEDGAAVSLPPGIWWWRAYPLSQAGTSSTAFSGDQGAAVGKLTVTYTAPPVPELLPEPPAIAETPAVPEPPAIAVNPAPLPLLPAPGNMSPAAGFVIDVAEARRSRSVTFSWNAVAGANAYNFTLYRESAGGTPVLNTRTAGTSYTIGDISALDNGNFIWQVEAVNLSGTPRRGRRAESRFAVDIPPPSQPVLGVSGTIYGN